jgi:hypothetical protein
VKTLYLRFYRACIPRQNRSYHREHLKRRCVISATKL